MLVSEKAYFKIEADIKNFDLNIKTRIDGIIILDAKDSSFIKDIFDEIYNVLVKESGF